MLLKNILKFYGKIIILIQICETSKIFNIFVYMELSIIILFV